MTRRLLIAALALLLGAGLLAGCSSDPNSVAEQAKSGDQKGYVSGDGSFETYAVADRGAPVALEGKTLTGEDWSATSVRGSVVVVNVWASWCPPCVAEMPVLQTVWSEVSSAKKPVAFIGINIRESAARGRALVEKTGVTFPSLSDKHGVLILALQGKAPTVPTTLVLDREGRIAARVSGPVEESVLRGLIDDVLADK